jgi:hypothetical protein
MQHQLRNPPYLVTTEQDERRAATEWQRFCTQATRGDGEFDPEKRVVIIDLGAGLGICSPPATDWQPVADDDESVGRAVREVLAASQPRRLPTDAAPRFRDEPRDVECIPFSFGPKTGWLAARGVPTHVLADALGLRDRAFVGLTEGTRRALDEGVFVLPPIDGWTLAVGVDLLHTAPPLAELSSRLGTTVQFFRTHRVVETHEWALAEHGSLRRAFHYSGERDERRESGAATDAERELELDRRDADPNEDDLFALAGRWSLDPTRLHERTADAPTGLWGRQDRFD